MSSSRKITKFTAAAALGAALALGPHAAFAADKPETYEATTKAADNTIARFTENDPDLRDHLDAAAGYVVFPVVGKAGVVVGGGGGEGILYEKGVPIGNAKVTFVNVGAQIGGQHFSELVILKDKAALKNFKQGKFGFQAGVSAVAAGAGASANLNYKDGVAVMTKTTGGLMAEATIGGQKFDYKAFDKPKPEPRT